MVQVNRGFALLVVLWVVAILSAVSLALISSTRAEARNSIGQWDQITAERLARSGQEFASYLQTRNIGRAGENLSGLPVEVETAGFKYDLRLPEGVVELILESDIGKINPATADPQLLRNFSTLWKGEPGAGQQLAEALEDWSDLDAEVRAQGAETGFYASMGYAPRNYGLGIADLSLIRGVSVEDFYPKIISGASGIDVRESLDRFLTPIPTGGQINPNFASRLVLQSVPGLNVTDVERIIAARGAGSFFRNWENLVAAAGLAADSPASRYFRFDQWMAPTTLTIVRNPAGAVARFERRVQELTLGFDQFTGTYETRVRLHRIEVDQPPEFVR